MSIFKWIGANDPWIAWALSIAIPITILEIGECASWICHRMIIIAASVLSFMTRNPKAGEEYKEIWLNELPQRPGKLIKIITTLVALLEAVLGVWWVLVAEGIPDKLYKRARRKITGWYRARNSSKSSPELAPLPGGLIAMRSRRSSPSTLIFEGADIRDLIHRIKNGDYDLESLMPNS
jgi:hypothetical protein